VDLIALPSGHTNGDTMIRFEKANVIMIGDFYRNYGYPFVDKTRGASFKGRSKPSIFYCGLLMSIQSSCPMV
jgi:hypothetical protein